MIESRVFVDELWLIEHGEFFTSSQDSDVGSSANCSNPWLKALHA